MLKFSFSGTWQGALGRAKGFGPWWPSVAHDPYHSGSCAACGRRIDYLFDFVKLVQLYTPVLPNDEPWRYSWQCDWLWHCDYLGLKGPAVDENDFLHSFCFDHGGHSLGKSVVSSLTGETIYIPPRLPEVVIVLRNICQWAVLKAAIGIRFLWYFPRFLAWSVIMRVYWGWLQWRHE